MRRIVKERGAAQGAIRCFGRGQQVHRRPCDPGQPTRQEPAIFLQTRKRDRREAHGRSPPRSAGRRRNTPSPPTSRRPTNSPCRATSPSFCPFCAVSKTAPLLPRAQHHAHRWRRPHGSARPDGQPRIARFAMNLILRRLSAGLALGLFCAEPLMAKPLSDLVSTDRRRLTVDQAQRLVRPAHPSFASGGIGPTLQSSEFRSTRSRGSKDCCCCGGRPCSRSGRQCRSGHFGWTSRLRGHGRP